MIELALVFLDPGLGRVVRTVGGAWREVDEKRFVRRGRLLLADPADRPARHGLREVPVGIVVRRLDWRGVLEQRRVPLARLAALESEEVAEALAGRPAVERSGGAQLMVGGVVSLAEGCGRIGVGLENLRHARRFARPGAVVAGETGRHFGDGSRVDRVVVASGENGGAGRGAKRRRVEAVVAQSFVRETLQGRSLDRAAEGARLAETHVVEQDQQHVGRAGGRGRRRNDVRFGVSVGAPYASLKTWFGQGQDIRQQRRSRIARVSVHGCAPRSVPSLERPARTPAGLTNPSSAASCANPDQLGGRFTTSAGVPMAPARGGVWCGSRNPGRRGRARGRS